MTQTINAGNLFSRGHCQLPGDGVKIRPGATGLGGTRRFRRGEIVAVLRSSDHRSFRAGREPPALSLQPETARQQAGCDAFVPAVRGSPFTPRS